MNILYFDIKQIQYFHLKEYSGMHKQNGKSSF